MAFERDRDRKRSRDDGSQSDARSTGQGGPASTGGTSPSNADRFELIADDVNIKNSDVPAKHTKSTDVPSLTSDAKASANNKTFVNGGSSVRASQDSRTSSNKDRFSTAGSQSRRQEDGYRGRHQAATGKNSAAGESNTIRSSRAHGHTSANGEKSDRDVRTGKISDGYSDISSRNVSSSSRLDTGLSSQKDNKPSTDGPVVRSADAPSEHSKSSGSRHASNNKKKKGFLIPLFIILGVILLAVLLWIFVIKDIVETRNAPPVPVSSVGMITGLEMGTTPKYSGVVDTPASNAVQKDDAKTIKEIFVDIGDEVQVGTPLFSYDTEQMTLDLTQIQIDIEGIDNRISTLKTQIAGFEKEKNSASEDDKLSYSLKISQLELDIRSEEQNRSSKTAELNSLQSSIANAQVVSEHAGVVKNITLTNQTDSNGNPLPFMSIQETGNLRVKGTVSEQNIGYLFEGQPVTIQSRIDPSMTWNGVVDKIDRENAIVSNSNMYYQYENENETKTSKYYFYIALENFENLIMGQHVFIEPELGNASNQREGLWLPAFYIVRENDDDVGFVWAQDENQRLEKRELIVGEYDAENDLYQIISGLSVNDLVAFPSENCKAGVPTVDAESDVYQNDMLMDNYSDEGSMADGYADDGAMEGGAMPEAMPDGGLNSVYYDEDGNPIDNADASVLALANTDKPEVA